MAERSTGRTMSIDPTKGMTPNDWVEMEARRLERRERIHREHGRQTSRRTRLLVGWAFGLAVVAAVVYTLLALFGLVPAPIPS
jgi:hypothetical protein